MGEGRSRWEKKDGSIGAGRKRKKKRRRARSLERPGIPTSRDCDNPRGERGEGINVSEEEEGGASRGKL
jgi:hypothetical protein